MSPSEVVESDAQVRVRILEIDEERRRISLSIKRVSEGGLPLRDALQPVADAAAAQEAAPEEVPDLGLSEEVFSDPPAEAEAAEPQAAEPEAAEPEATDPEAADPEAAEPGAAEDQAAPADDEAGSDQQG